MSASPLDLAHARPKTVTKPPLDQMAAPLLRKDQVQDMQEQLKGLDAKIKASGRPFGGTASIADTRKAMSRVRKQLEEQSPRAYEPGERDDAVAAEQMLREDIQEGMPTDEEMRRNPPGAVGKHQAWEKRKKRKILAWKNIRRRLQASGMLRDTEIDGHDVGNVERLRQRASHYQLPMDHAQIRGNGRDFHFPESIEPKNLMSDAEREASDAETKAILRIFAQTKDPAERKRLLADMLNQGG